MANGLSPRAQGIADGTWHTRLLKKEKPKEETKKSYYSKTIKEPELESDSDISEED